MTQTAMPTFSRGGDEAQQADEAARAAAGGNFKKINYLPKIGPSKQIVLRYVTDSDAWVWADAHPSAPTKPQPSWWSKDHKWPESMPATCRYDKNLKDFFTDCYIDDAKLQNQWGRLCKPVIRVWVIACLREEVIGTDAMVTQGVITAHKVGKRVGFKDQTREIEVTGDDGKPTGDKIIEPALIVVNKATTNYFGGLQSCYGIYTTVCDRDYVVKQEGEGKDVQFRHIPLDPTPNLKPGTEKWQRYLDAVEKQDINLDRLVWEKANDEFFALFFDPSKTPVERGKKDGDKSTTGTPTSAPEGQQAAAPSNDVDPEKLAAMRERVRGNTGATHPDAAVDNTTTNTPAPPAAASTEATSEFD